MKKAIFYSGLALALMALGAFLFGDFTADARRQPSSSTTVVATRSSVNAPPAAAPLAITAPSAIVVEASTGRVVYEKNADAVMYPASLTKIVTCMLALENSSLESRVPINMGDDADTWLKESGRSVKLGELLTEMMLLSDNGAAVAVAEHISGSVEKFGELMTDTARRLGATHTTFRNPNGLPDDRHVTTARDLMLLTRHAWQNEQFRRIVGTAKRGIYYADSREPALFAENTNELLGAYKGMCGIKTGWTSAAGGCFAGAATRNGLTLLTIVLNSADAQARFDDTTKLLDDGFARVRMIRGPVKERLKRSVDVEGGSSGKLTAHPAVDIKYPLIGDEQVRHYGFAVRMPKSVRAPILKGDTVGEVVISYSGHEVGRVDMLADCDVPEPSDPLTAVLTWIASLLP